MYPSVSAQPDFPAQEEEILAFWRAEKIFEKSLAKNQDGEPYIIYDGPPTANAKPPLHTIVPMSFKDLVGRYQTMKGRYVPRQAGWDTHGLPVEVQVEKALGLSGKKEILNLVPGDPNASIAKFNEICRTSVWEYKQEWDKFVPRVGYWMDIDHPYITYQPEYVEKEWGVFKRIWDKGMVYKGYKVLPYCPRCGTGLSSAEVAQEYHDTKDVSVYVAFPLVDQPRRSLLAWTTTPWTLPGNVALAVGKGIEYVVIRQADGAEYILAKARLEIVEGDYEIVEELKGEQLLGRQYQPPYPEVLADRTEPKHLVVAADFVTTEDGTGIVHTAVMYGEDDFQLGQQLGLPMKHSVGLDGRFLDNVPEFAGLYVRDALVPILKSLQEKNRLYKKQTITHSYPYCWRCKTPLIYYAKDSWYIAMSKLRGELLNSNETVAWYPEHIKEGRFGDFIREARDWAISRERFWGTPLPIWVSVSGKMLCVGSFAELKQLAKDPDLVGEEFDPHRPTVDAIILVKDGEEYVREPVVMDVWFDSGSMPYASGRDQKGQFPADYIAEAVDQTRGWFNSLLAIGTIVKGQSPYRRVTCMGHLVDAEGKKMSKSGTNAVNPAEVFSSVGVDAIRWFLYTVNSPGEPKAFNTKEVQTAFRKSVLLLWNILNYFVTYANLAEVSVPAATGRQQAGAGSEQSILDRWALSRQAAVTRAVSDFMDQYDFMRAGRTVEEYINELSTWYLRRSRKRTDERFFFVLYDLLMRLTTLMAPFVPFVTEKIYQTLRSADMPESVHLMDWPEPAGSVDLELEHQMNTVRQIVELGLSVRAAEKVKVRQPLAKAYLELKNGRSIAPELIPIIADELNVLEVVMGAGEGLPVKENEEVAVAMDTALTDDLIQAGLAREFLRQIQQARKERGLKAGQEVILRAGPGQRAIIEPLLAAYPAILTDAFLKVDPKQSWSADGSIELDLNGQPVPVDFIY